MGDIGFRLVIVVVAYEIFHGVIREKLPELRAQLRRKRLVVGQHQSRPVQLFDDGSHGESFAGNAQQSLLPQSPVDSVYQGANGLRLISRGLVFRNQMKTVHLFLLQISRQSSKRTPDWAMET